MSAASRPLKGGKRCGAVLALRADLQGREGALAALTLAGVVSGPARWVYGVPHHGVAEHPAALTHLPPSNPPSLQIIKKLIERKQAQIRKVYPGLTCFKEGVRQIPIESVPGIRESWQGVWQEGSVLPPHGCRADVVTLTLVFQEKQDGNHWGRRRGECCMRAGVDLQQQGWGAQLCLCLSPGIGRALEWREADGHWLCPAGRN